MKKAVITLALLATLISTAHASSDSDQFCSAVGKLAESIMFQRQNALPIGTLMDAVDKVPDVMKDMARMMVMKAYEQPAFTLDEFRKPAIREFADSFQLECYKQFSKQPLP